MNSKIFEYQSDKFVNRDHEIREFLSHIDIVLRDKTLKEKSIAIEGHRGTGKSWLLRHLYEILSDKRGKWIDVSHSVLLDLRSYVSDPSIATRNLWLDLIGELGFLDSKSVPRDMYEKTEKLEGLFTEKFEEFEPRKQLVVFLDHVWEMDWNFLCELEDKVLRALVKREAKDVVVVLSGRLRPYRWNSPELTPYKVIRIERFNEHNTRLQIQKRNSSIEARIFKDIFKKSKGFPLLNQIYGSDAGDDGFFQSAQNAVENTLNILPLDERQRTHEYLEALCVIRSVDPSHVMGILPAYYGENIEYGYKKSKQVSDHLMKHSLAYGDGDSITMDEGTQVLYQNYLKIADPPKWKKLNRVAIEFYEEQIKNFPQNKEFCKRCEEEISYHRKALAEKIRKRRGAL